MMGRDFWQLKWKIEKFWSENGRSVGDLSCIDSDSGGTIVGA